MNEQDQWTQQKYDEAWAEYDRQEYHNFQRRFRIWNALIVIWILASVGVLVLTIAVKLFNAIRGG